MTKETNAKKKKEKRKIFHTGTPRERSTVREGEGKALEKGEGEAITPTSCHNSRQEGGKENEEGEREKEGGGWYAENCRYPPLVVF